MVTSCAVRKFAEVPMVFRGYRSVQPEGAIVVVRGCRARSNGHQEVLLKGAIAVMDRYRMCTATVESSEGCGRSNRFEIPVRDADAG